MTAFSQRRTRRTILAATVAVGLVVAASVLVTVGVIALSNSTAGQAVGIDTRPREVFPPTPNALLAVTDDQGQLASLVVLTLLPGGTGGSIVTVPVNADATTGFGLQRRPLNAIFAPADIEGFAATVADMLSISIQQSAVVDPAGLQTLLAPLGPVQVVLPDAVIDSDAPGAPSPTTTVAPGPTTTTTSPRSTTTTTTTTVASDTTGTGSEVPPQVVGIDGVVTTAGPQILDTTQVVGTLTSIDGSVLAYDQHPIDVAMWSAIAETAPVGTAGATVTTDGLGVAVAPATVGTLVAQLFAGPVGVRDIAASPATVSINPTDEDVVVLDRRDSTLVFAQVSPSLVSTPNTGLKMRVVAQFTDAQLAATNGVYDNNADLMRDMIGRLLFLQANVVSVDTAGNGGPAVTVIEVRDPALIDETKSAGKTLFGQVDVRVATTVLEGVDIAVTLGTSYLDAEVAKAADSNGDAGLVPESTTPGDTVAPEG